MSFIGPIKNLFHQVNVTAGFNIPGYEKDAEHDHGIEAPEVDVYEQGAWWKNKAVKVGLIDEGAEKCACGGCPSCVSVLYALQASTYVNGSLPEKEEGGLPMVNNQEKLVKPKEETADPDNDPSKEELAKPEGKQPGEEINLREQMELTRLRAIDEAVRGHERAHMAVAGGLVRGGVSYQYKVGPDGKRYAVGGEVSIDTSKGMTPEDTIRKMEAVRAAALAPAVPSSQDRRVAAQASMAIIQAKIELNSQERAEAEQVVKDNTTAGAESRNIEEPA